MDSIFKSIKEVTTVLELAVYLEEKGIDFYKKRQQSVEDPFLQSVFQYLADEEIRHRETFIRLLERAGGEYLALENLVGEYQLFMDMLVNEAIQLLDMENVMTPQAAIRSAIHFEKESLLLYYEISRLIDENNRETIMQICDEEKKHIMKLMAVR